MTIRRERQQNESANGRKSIKSPEEAHLSRVFAENVVKLVHLGWFICRRGRFLHGDSPVVLVTYDDVFASVRLDRPDSHDDSHVFDLIGL